MKRFVHGATTPFKITSGLIIVLIVYYILTSNRVSRGVEHYYPHLIIGTLAVLIGIGLNITLFMGFLNAGGINHVAGFYVMICTLGRMINDSL